MLVPDPTLFGLFAIDTSIVGFIQHTGLIWLALGIGGLIFRTVHLFFIKDVMSGLVWMSKILTDPFNDVVLYYNSPLALLRGEMLDPQHKPSRI